MDEKNINNHKIVIDNRQHVEVEGVIDVLAFDEQEIVLETEQGMMTIMGANLHVNQLNLNNGKVQLDGEIESLSYSDNDGYTKSGSIFGKLFRG